MVLNQEKRINNNENEIKKLKEKNEKQFIENKNNIDKINSKLSNQEKDVAKLIKINKKNPVRSNEEIDEINEKNINRYITNFSNKEKIMKELHELKGLEKTYGFLSCIGVKLLLKHNFNEIEGFIRAPDNSPYKNGIFNFIVKLPEDYRDKPEVKFKTRIFHTEATEDNSKCCIYWDFLNIPNEGISLSLILIGIYEFFFCNNDNGYAGKVTDIYRSKNYNLFEEKCQEYIKLYSFNIHEEKLEYFIQNCYDNINDDSIYYFMNAKNMCKYEFEVKCIDDIIKILIDRFENLIDQVLIADNKIYFSLTEIKEIEELPENHKIIIAPKLIQGK